MARQEQRLGRREFLKAMAASGVASGLRWKRVDVGSWRKEEEDPKVEAIKEYLEGITLRADRTQVEIIRMEETKKGNGEWVEMTGKDPMWWYNPELAVVNNVEFNAVGIESEFYPAEVFGDEDLYVFKGYVPNMTGDSSRWKVEIGRFYPRLDKFRWMVRKVQAVADQESGLEVSFGAWARRTWYPNKVFNILRALNDFRHNMIEGFGPGETFSFLEAIDLEEHLKDVNYYQYGWNTQERLVPAGGVCGFDVPTANASYLAEKKGFVEILEITAHSAHPYFVNRENQDMVDATAEIKPNGSKIDLVVKNISDRRLWYVVRVDLLMEDEFAQDYHLPNSIVKPTKDTKEVYDACPELVLTVTLTDKQPSLEDSQSVEIALERMIRRQKKYGIGSRNGFNRR